jgi:CheY-like chemotaxis protein
MMKILIDEDVALNADLLVHLLEDEYDLILASDGLDGVELAAAERPYLILMDMSLPGIDGYEATRRIRANPALASAVIVRRSAQAMRESPHGTVGLSPMRRSGPAASFKMWACFELVR